MKNQLTSDQTDSKKGMKHCWPDSMGQSQAVSQLSKALAVLLNTSKENDYLFIKIKHSFYQLGIDMSITL